MEMHKKEIARKSIHLSSFLIPLSYRYLLPLLFTGSIKSIPTRTHQKIAVLVLSLLAVISLIIEILRTENNSFRKLFEKTLGKMMRVHEKKNITGATFLLVSSIVCISFFPYNIAFVCLSFLVIGDTMAAIIGMSVGKRKIVGTDKSVEGSLACFISTFIFSLFFLNPILALTGSFTATLAELTSLGIDDNFKIPVISGATMSVASMFI